MIRNILWVGFLFRFAVAVWNGFFGPSFGAGGDAAGFQEVAVEFSKNVSVEEFKITYVYPYVLGFIYYITTDSLFLGSLLSAVAWFASGSIFIKTMRLFSISKSNQSKAMLIYVLLPSSILYTSVTLREPYQLLFVNLAIYSALKIYMNRSFAHWLFLAVAMIGMGVLHGALLALGLFVMITTLIMLTLWRGRHFSFKNLLLVMPLIVPLALYGLLFFSDIAYNLDEGLGTAISNYQSGALVDAEGARANYKVGDFVEFKGVSDLILFVPVSIVQYFLEPFPWHVSSVTDLPVVFENALRAWLIWQALFALRHMKDRRERSVLLVFLSFILLETMWSLGTINWGTAARHHIPGTGLLLIAAFAYAKTPVKHSRAIVPSN